MQRTAAAVLVAFGVAAGGTVAHAVTSPPSLVRTLLAASESPTAESGDITVQYSCDMTVGGTFSVTYTASGTAAGPYPGTFVETGAVTGVVTTVDSLGIYAQGTLTSWHADFTIDSTVGDVTGTKRLAASVPGFTCFDGGFRGQPYDEETAAAGAQVSYDAVIRTSDGAFSDTGAATSDVGGPNCTNEPGSTVDYCAELELEYLAEDFYLSDGVLPLPSDEDGDGDGDGNGMTTGMATGGGRVLSGADRLDVASFGFNVRSVDSRPRGTCNVLDQSADVHVRCLTVDSYAQVGNTVVWTGTADVDGVTQRYRITVQDNGEPNGGTDTFSIDTDTYDAGGAVTDGNVQVHTTTAP